MRFRFEKRDYRELRGAFGHGMAILAPPSKRAAAAQKIARLFSDDHPVAELGRRLAMQRSTCPGELYVIHLGAWPGGLSDSDIELARAALVSAGFRDASAAYE